MNIDRDALREVLREELNARARIDVETHADHHAFIGELIDRAQRRRELFDRVRQQVIGWALIASLGAIGTWAARELSKLVDRG